MRILVTSSYWPRPSQASPVYFEVDQARALTDLGHDIFVLLPTSPWKRGEPFYDARALGLDPSMVRIQQITMPRLPERFSESPYGTLINIRAAGLRMAAWLRHHEELFGPVQAVIVHGERNIGLSAGLWNKGRARKTAMIVHGVDPVLERLPSQFLRRKVASSVNSGTSQIILVGSRLWRYTERLGYDPARVRVVFNGFRLPSHHTDLQPRPRPAEPVQIVCAARLIKLKGIDYLLLALAQLKKNNPALEWRLQILGDGPERSNLEQIAGRNGIQHYISFRGAVKHEEVLRALQASAIFALPSWKEAFGLVYLEAMALGNAVIGCEENGAADIITDGLDGFLVPPHDVEALTETLRTLIMDHDRRMALTEAAKVRVLDFSWSKNAMRISQFLENE